MTTEEEKLVTENLKMAYDIIWSYRKKYSSNIIELDELKSLAFLGLSKAASTFSPELGYQFSTYAYKCMNNEISNYMRKNKKYQTDISLFDKLYNNDDESIEIQDSIPDNIDITKISETNNITEELYKHIDTLKGRQKLIIKYYLQGISFVEMSKIFKVSQPQISRDYQQALRALRNKLKHWR